MSQDIRLDDIRDNARIVMALNGRDKDKLLAVVGEQDGYILVADGKRRSLGRPKRKNPRHIKPMNGLLVKEQLRSDKALRRALRCYTEGLAAAADINAEAE